MQPRSQFHPVRQRSEDGTRSSSIEMLTMDPNAPHHNPDGHNSNKSARWKSTEKQPTFREKWSPFPWRITLIILTLPLALAPIVTLSAAAETASQFYIRNRDCYPNGLWKHSPGATWEIMDSSYFFTPNLSFGKMTFTQVKVIDIAWDLIIGRGGQLLLAWVNYRVFNEWLVYHMEHHLASYKLYASVAFETTTLGTLGVLAKEWLAFGSTKTFWRSFFRWLAMLSMLLSTLYVLSFPTLMAAMTGYIAMTEPYVQNRDLNLINFGKVDVIRYIIEDARAIGYDNPLIVGARDESLVKAVKTYVVTTAPSGPQPDEQQESIWQVNSSSIWNLDGKSTSLPAPSLKIKSFPTRFQRDVDDEDVRANASWLIDGRQSEVYNWTYIVEHGSCKPSETYQWGFSYIFLFMVSIFNFIWSCIMVGMWYDTRRGSRMYKSGRRPGLLRSVMEYAAAIREEIGEGGEALEEDEIRQRLTNSGGALTVPKHELKVRRTDTGEERVKKRTWKSSITKGSTF